MNRTNIFRGLFRTNVESCEYIQPTLFRFHPGETMISLRGRER